MDNSSVSGDVTDGAGPWLTTGQVAQRWGSTTHAVTQRRLRGQLEGVRRQPAPDRRPVWMYAETAVIASEAQWPPRSQRTAPWSPTATYEGALERELLEARARAAEAAVAEMRAQVQLNELIHRLERSEAQVDRLQTEVQSLRAALLGLLGTSLPEGRP